MAVPDTNTFNLQDVTNEFGLGPGDSLQDCFNDSDGFSYFTTATLYMSILLIKKPKATSSFMCPILLNHGQSLRCLEVCQ